MKNVFQKGQKRRKQKQKIIKHNFFQSPYKQMRI